MHVVSGLQKAFWQHPICYFHKQFERIVYPGLAYNVYRSRWEWILKIATVKLEKHIITFKSLLRAQQHSTVSLLIYIMQYMAFFKNTLLYKLQTYQKVNQNGLDKPEENPHSRFLSIYFNHDKWNSHFDRNPHLYKMEKLLACQIRRKSDATMCQKINAYQQYP